MTIRPPAGIIDHSFDGMQLQAPRLVLAEAAMDALFLNYADPDLAAEVILGHFESSPRPNLPCMREDGGYNMVADDGQICGTAPEWGFPLWCCDKLFARMGDLHWLRRLYPTVPWGDYVLGIKCTVRDSKGYTMRMHCARRGMEEATNAVEHGELQQPGKVQRCEWEGTWGEEHKLQLPGLMLLS